MEPIWLGPVIIRQTDPAVVLRQSASNIDTVTFPDPPQASEPIVAPRWALTLS